MTRLNTLQSPERIFSKFEIVIIFALLLPITTTFAQVPSNGNKQGTTKNENDIITRMLDYSGPGENHAILDQLAGKWNFVDPKRSFIKGTLSRKPIYDGRFYTVEITGGKLPLPIGNGKMKDGNYQNLQIEGYDNPKEKFVTISINNHIGSDIEMQFGSFDKGKNTFTYEWETELVPGLKKTNTRILRIVDKHHYIEEYFETQDGHQVKIRELDYVRSSE